MSGQGSIHLKIEKTKLLVKISAVAGSVSILLALVVLFTGIVNPWAGLDTYALAFIPLTVSSIFCVLGLIYGLLAGRAAQEEEEKSLLERRKESVGAFNVAEDVRFTAGRTLENFKKYTPQVMAVILPLLLGLGLYIFWRSWAGRVGAVAPANPLPVAFLAAVFMCISIFMGAFLSGQSHEKEFRWLRPVGAWLILSFVTLLLAALAGVLLKLQKGPSGEVQAMDPYFRTVIFWLYAVLAVEFVSNFITEFYRPRTLEEERPVFESRLLALFTEPGGVMRNIAETLDYQFGFKVSKTWIYSFAERSLFPLLALWLLTLWLFTCISEVAPGEVGIRERWGCITGKPLASGIYFKLPWPAERIQRCPVDRIQELVIGPQMTTEAGVELRPEVVLWTKKHYAQDARFLVATEKDRGSGKEIPVSILSASIALQFRVKNDGIIDYVYGHYNTPQVLKDIAERAVSSYLVSVDMIKVMSKEREKVVDDLYKQIQDKADQEKLGVEILSVSLHDAHPPVEEVAASFQDVIGAREEKAATILAAQAQKLNILGESESNAERIMLDAKAYKTASVRLAEAEAERFKKQLDAYLAAPSVFKLRVYLDFLENEAKNTRKYVMSTTIPYQIFEINLEEKARLDLLDVNLGDIQGNK